jgi:ArsR family transcriptional regulator
MRPKSPDVARYAEMLTALGTEHRLRIMRLLLSAHPDGLVACDIQKELGLTSSNCRITSRS